MDPFLTGAVSALFAGGVAYLLFRSRQATLCERLQTRAADVARLEGETEALRREVARLSVLQAGTAARLDAETSAHQRLTHEFKALSADALRANRGDFLAEARLAFGELQRHALGDLDLRRHAVEALVKPIRDSLEKVDGRIEEMERARAGAYGALGEQLQSLNLAQLQLQSEAARLSTALRSTRYAGSWGELQLRRVVEMADMLEYCDFSVQQSSGGLRADLVVRLPGGQRIVVDAKTPLESYRAASADTPDDATRTSRLVEHAQNVRGHIDALGAKSYWEQFQPSPEFVVLFLPGDHFLTAALQSDNSLLDRALSRRVLLATPMTLIALLRAAACGWRQEAVSKSADEISALGRVLYERITSFAEALEKVGRGLDSATKGYNAAVGSFEGMLVPGARKLAEFGARGPRDLTPPTVLESNIRDVGKRT